MKTKLLISTAFFAVCGIANAQITITQADIAGWGSVIRQATDTLPTVTIKPGGTGNQTWNFSALNTHLTDTLTFSNPALLTGSGAFPSSNLGVEQKGQSQNPDNFFLSINFGSLNILGFYLTGYDAIQINPNEQGLVFPSSYPSATFNDTSGFDFKYPYTSPTIDSIRTKRVKVKTVNIDAYGNITTPLGTYNTLRQKEYITEADTVWGHDFTSNVWIQLQVTTKTYYHFVWMANGWGWPLAEMDSMISPNAGTIQNVKWMKSTTVTGVALIDNQIPDKFSLNQNYPNPFNPTTTIEFSLPQASDVSLKIYNSLGVEVARLVNENLQPGNYKMDWNASGFASGVYFYHLKAEDFTKIKKLVLLK